MHKPGNALPSGLAALCAPAYPEPGVPCSCGQQAYQQTRSVQVLTLLGPVVVKRPYYLCFSCHHGTASLDQQLGIRAGGISAGLANALALVGVQLPFEKSAQLLEQLTGVAVYPNTVREATETLEAVVIAGEEEAIAAA